MNRRTALLDSFFTVTDEGEKVITISLSAESETEDGPYCITCHLPVEPDGVRIGFAVCARCAVVVDIETEAPAREAEAG